MALRVAILYNDDSGLAHGEAQDRFAAQGVIAEVSALEQACLGAGFEPVRIAVSADPRRLLGELDRLAPDVVFNAAEAVAGDSRLEAAVAWLLELARLPYTGCPPLALSVALDKPMTRAILAARGIAVARGAVLEQGDDALDLPGDPPWIVKPAREDASHGISGESVVDSEAAVRARARYVIERYRQPALIEEFIDGRELNVSILGAGDQAEVLPLAEIDFSRFPPGRARLVTYEAKWVETSADYLGTPSVAAQNLDPALAGRVAQIALSAYRALGLRDYGRVDLRIHPQRGPLVLEVNPNPDISPDAGLARAAARKGLSYVDLIGGIVNAARARGASSGGDGCPS